MGLACRLPVPRRYWPECPRTLTRLQTRPPPGPGSALVDAFINRSADCCNGRERFGMGKNLRRKITGRNQIAQERQGRDGVGFPCRPSSPAGAGRAIRQKKRSLSKNLCSE